MSFSSDVKHEICQVALDEGQAKAQLCALFLMRATLNMNRQGTYLSFQTENAAIAKHVFRLLKEQFQVEAQLSVLKKMNLKKNNIYRLQIFSKTNEILEELSILRETGLSQTPSYKLVRSEKNARAFLQGAFLASGSINSPRSAKYHMEISCTHEALALNIQKIMERFYLPSRMIERKGASVVYIKTGEKIADFLRLLCASAALFEFEDTRIQRDFYNQITRLDNCELANEMKSLKAGQEQLKWIECIEQAGRPVSLKLQQVMDVRKKNPEASIVELCDAVYVEYGEVISKSGMKHRLKKLKELALSLCGEETT